MFFKCVSINTSLQNVVKTSVTSTFKICVTVEVFLSSIFGIKPAQIYRWWLYICDETVKKNIGRNVVNQWSSSKSGIFTDKIKHGV